MLQVINGPTIQVGESLSDVIDCSAGQLVRIIMPAAWNRHAVLTFQVSNDGQTFNELYGLDGYAVTIKEVVPNSCVIIPADVGRAISFIRFRAGSEGNPDAQEEARVFSVGIVVGEKTVPVAVFDPIKGPPKPRPPRPKIARKKRRT